MAYKFSTDFDCFKMGDSGRLEGYRLESNEGYFDTFEELKIYITHNPMGDDLLREYRVYISKPGARAFEIVRYLHTALDPEKVEEMANEIAIDLFYNYTADYNSSTQICTLDAWGWIDYSYREDGLDIFGDDIIADISLDGSYWARILDQCPKVERWKHENVDSLTETDILEIMDDIILDMIAPTIYEGHTFIACKRMAQLRDDLGQAIADDALGEDSTYWNGGRNLCS